jgi:hypothetical protein
MGRARAGGVGDRGEGGGLSVAGVWSESGDDAATMTNLAAVRCQMSCKRSGKREWETLAQKPHLTGNTCGQWSRVVAEDKQLWKVWRTV